MHKILESPCRICIVTPGQLGSNPRVVKEAQTLHEASHDVIVIATRVLDLVEPRDQAIMKRVPWQVHRIDFRSRNIWHMRRLAQIGAARLNKLAGNASLASYAFSAFTPPLIGAASKQPAGLYIAHYPAALPAAAAAARRYGAAYAYDAEDFHAGEFLETLSGTAMRDLVLAIERKYLAGAVYVTAAAPGIAEAYQETYGIARPVVVRNTFPLWQAPAAPAPKGVATPGPSIYWFSQTIGPGRGLEHAVRAISAARTQPHLYLRGTPARGFIETLQYIARGAGVAERIHVLPPDQPDTMVRLASEYDLGLCGETGHHRGNDLVLSNKLFTFMLAGVPPLMSSTAAQLQFAGEAGLMDFVYAADQPGALAQRIDGLLSDPPALAAARAKVWHLGRERYNWEQDGAILRDTIAKVFRG